MTFFPCSVKVYKSAFRRGYAVLVVDLGQTQIGHVALRRMIGLN